MARICSSLASLSLRSCSRLADRVSRSFSWRSASALGHRLHPRGDALQGGSLDGVGPDRLGLQLLAEVLHLGVGFGQPGGLGVAEEVGRVLEHLAQAPVAVADLAGEGGEAGLVQGGLAAEGVMQLAPERAELVAQMTGGAADLRLQPLQPGQELRGCTLPPAQPGEGKARGAQGREQREEEEEGEERGPSRGRA